MRQLMVKAAPEEEVRVQRREAGEVDMCEVCRRRPQGTFRANVDQIYWAE